MQVKTTKINEYKIRYIEEGTSNKTIILLHGLGASAERWLPIFRNFSKYYHVIAPDIIGFGYSDKPHVSYTLSFFTQFLSDFIASLSIKNPIIIGSSLGGRILLEYAINDSRKIDKAVFVSPAINDKASYALYSYVQAALHPTLADAEKAFHAINGNNKEMNIEILNEFVNRMKLPNAKLSFMSSLIGLKKSILTEKKISQITVPSLLIWGSEDNIIPISNAQKLISSIKGLQYYEMGGCGHAPFAEKPDLFSRVILEFLDTHD